MIQYSSMTLQEAIDEVMNRAGQFRTATNLDWQTVRMFVNRARREVLNTTLPYKDWAYIEQVPILHGGIKGQPGGVPEDYIRFVRVILRDPSGAGEYHEARYADPREFYTLANWRNRQSWNHATVDNPVFTLWGAINSVPPEDGLIFYAAPNADHQTGTAPEGFSYYTGAPLEGFMDCYRGLRDLTLAAEVLSVPYEFENAVILGATLRCYHKLGELQKLELTQRAAFGEMRRIRELTAAKRETERINLESFEDSGDDQRVR